MLFVCFIYSDYTASDALKKQNIFYWEKIDIHFSQKEQLKQR